MIEHEALRLSAIFIDLASFCVMSNHYHVPLHINPDHCRNARAIDVAKRWHMLFKGNDMSQRFSRGEFIEPHEQESLDSLIDVWRTRLQNISWFMKVLNEKISRQANLEDGCTGHFWQARFKSQPLLDEKAVLACMAYIDLNPVRAAMADTTEDSDHTSIQLRIRYWKDKAQQLNAAKNTKSSDESDEEFQPKSLMPFVGNPRQPMPFGLAYNLMDYLARTIHEMASISRRDLFSP